MIWYYAQDRNRLGPIDEAEFQGLVQAGVITPETLVWNETLPNWARYAEVMPPTAPAYGQERRPVQTCHECGRLFPEDNMIPYQEAWICAACKPVFVQKLKEGAYFGAGFEYAGFWIRFAAKFLDGLIQGAATMAIGIVTTLLTMTLSRTSGAAIAMQLFTQLLSIGIAVAYSVYFVGKFAATPGKMICGLKVVMADGAPVSYGRAVGRYFACDWLNPLTLGIGYIMAGFDDEKRGLHDRICETRVVKK
jgi:uncharacterized RDD family membrane protein YckC